VVVQVGALFPRELANSDTGIDPPRIEQLVSDFGNDQQLLAAREGDVALVEQMVNVGRQQQPVRAVKPFPRLSRLATA
jgi:hypothetical protein